MLSYIPDTEHILQDLFLVEFVEEFYGECTFVDKEQLIKWGKFFDQNPNRGITSISNGFPYCPPLDNALFITLDEYFLGTSFVITKILELGNGKICACGPKLLLFNDFDSNGYFDFYFNSCTILEAVNLLAESLKLLQDRHKRFLNLKQRPYFVRDNTITITNIANIERITFHLTIFKDKGQMLKKIGPSIFGAGYNIKDGLFSTISCGITTALGAFPIENNLRNEHCKEIIEAGITVLFPGYNNTIPIGGKVKVSGGEIVNNEDFIDIRIGEDNVLSEPTIKQDLLEQDLMLKFSYYKDSKIRSTKLAGWILEDYKPFVVGISDDRYIALSGIRKKFNLNDDVFKILCNWWLIQEGGDAKQRLLNLQYS